MRSKPALLLSLLVASLTAAGGCEVAHISDPLTTKLGGADDDSQMEFWHALAERPLASNDEAAHALLLFTNFPAPEPTYASRLATLKSKGLLPASFNAPSDEAVKRGTVAYALCKALNIKGGITMHLLGDQPRYAVRELVDLELFPYSSPDQTFSGTELVGVIGRAEDYQRGGAGEKTPGGISDRAH